MCISFCGLKENVLYGCKAVGDVKKDFPNGLLMSNTYYDLFEKEKNLEVQESLEAAIDRTRFIVDQYIRQGFSSKDAVEKAVKKTGVANCGEQAVLVSRQLDEIGISNRVIQMDICRNSKDRFVTGGHTFCLIGASQDMDIKEPKTWGKKLLSLICGWEL